MNAAVVLARLRELAQLLLPYLAFGFLFELCERFWPIRKRAPAAEWRLDWLGFVLQLAYGTVYVVFVAPIVETSPLLAWLRPLHDYLGTCPAIVCFLVYFVAYDFFSYWLHRLQHHPWIWSLHAFHHSSRRLHWISGARGSLFHECLTTLASTLALLVVPFAGGRYFWGYFLYTNAHNSFIHSNIRVNSRLFNAVFMTGEHHFVHHAKDLRAGNSNFAFIFTFWDRLFGTWVDPRTMPADFELGLDCAPGATIDTTRLILGLPAVRASAPAHAPKIEGAIAGEVEAPRRAAAK